MSWKSNKLKVNVSKRKQVAKNIKDAIGEGKKLSRSKKKKVQYQTHIALHPNWTTEPQPKDIMTEQTMEEFVLKAGWQKGKMSWSFNFPHGTEYRTLRQAYRMQYRINAKGKAPQKMRKI